MWHNPLGWVEVKEKEKATGGREGQAKDWEEELAKEGDRRRANDEGAIDQ